MKKVKGLRPEEKQKLTVQDGFAGTRRASPMVWPCGWVRRGLPRRLRLLAVTVGSGFAEGVGAMREGGLTEVKQERRPRNSARAWANGSGRKVTQPQYRPIRHCEERSDVAVH
jgi:hypothetical protein